MISGWHIFMFFCRFTSGPNMVNKHHFSQSAAGVLAASQSDSHLKIMACRPPHDTAPRVAVEASLGYAESCWCTGEDIRQCERGVHVVSGTPGRVFDMIKRRSLRTRSIRTLVLDEADEMLAKGFKEQIYEVYRYLPPDTQVGMAVKNRLLPPLLFVA